MYNCVVLRNVCADTSVMLLLLFCVAIDYLFQVREMTSPSRKPLMEKGEVHRAYYVNVDDDSKYRLGSVRL